MRHSKLFVVTAAVISMLAAAAAVAQQPAHQHEAAQQAPASGPKPAMPAQGHDVHHAQHMEMCRQMMGQSGQMMGQSGMMGGGVMGMPMMGGDPKQQADMLAMRGEMMKAMGDIMMKYAQRAQPVK